jgi:hypothetical protein
VIILWLILNPRPVPLPGSFVVKNGSKIRQHSSAEVVDIIIILYRYQSCTGIGPSADNDNTDPKVWPSSLLALRKGTRVPLP